MDIASVGNFVEVCARLGLLAGLAGSLETPDIPRLLFARARCAWISPRSLRGRSRPDLAPRCRRDRYRARPDPGDSRKANTSGCLGKSRLPAAGGARIFVCPGKHEAETDRIFVRDFVLPVRIGAYAHEREKPQNVRFNVDVKVLRPDRVVEDIRDVFSYDLITDAIRMVIAQEHIALVEMLAERIAALILAHPRVTSTTVRVEKLEVGPGAAGVEIVRRRTRKWPRCISSIPPQVKPIRKWRLNVRCSLGPVVVKLGGSFAFSVHLRAWIEAMAGCAGQVVIVPGGGPFADAVRVAQTQMGFDDRAAHQMAVLAMEQYGRALANFNSALSPADSARAIRKRLDVDRVPVWLPTPTVFSANDIPWSWDVTADSLRLGSPPGSVPSGCS